MKFERTVSTGRYLYKVGSPTVECRSNQWEKYMYIETMLGKWKYHFVKKNLLLNHSLTYLISQCMLSSNFDQTLPDVHYSGGGEGWSRNGPCIFGAHIPKHKTEKKCKCYVLILGGLMLGCYASKHLLLDIRQ